jgi:hypothetical protein
VVRADSQLSGVCGTVVVTPFFLPDPGVILRLWTLKTVASEQLSGLRKEGFSYATSTRNLSQLLSDLIKYD